MNNNPQYIKKSTAESSQQAIYLAFFATYTLILTA